MYSQLSIIVPGIAGSKLYCNCSDNTQHKRLYPRKGWFFNSAIHKHTYDCSKITTKPLKTFWYISIYDKLIKKLKSTSFNKVETFSYDWRRDPTELAEDLLQFIKQHNPSQFTHLKIIGHSLGGLLIRIMLEYFNGLSELYISPEQITVYQCGTPMYGSQNVQDYNYGFELAAVLASSGLFCSSCPLQRITQRSIRNIKPFLFSVSDLKKIIKESPKSLLYLLPTPMINTLYLMLENGNLQINSCDNFDRVHQVHSKLANLSFPVKYIFFFNISYHKVEKVYIPFRTNDLFNNITVHDIQPRNIKHGCGIYLKRLLKSDKLVVPYNGQRIPYNCSIYVDESEKCQHAHLMNSSKLWTIIFNSHSTFEYYNTIYKDNLPEYDEIFNT